MIPQFENVDAGCLMFEKNEGRWIIELPKNGSLQTLSKQWDVIIEHPENPHSKPLKFLGSFTSKTAAIKFIKKLLSKGINYFNSTPEENQFYRKDYSKK